MLGCSQKIVTEQKEMLATLPDSLIIDPCGPTGAGETVRSLAKAYIKNNGCIREYKLLLQKQREYKKKVEALYNGN